MATPPLTHTMQSNCASICILNVFVLLPPSSTVIHDQRTKSYMDFVEFSHDHRMFTFTVSLVGRVASSTITLWRFVHPSLGVVEPPSDCFVHGMPNTHRSWGERLEGSSGQEEHLEQLLAVHPLAYHTRCSAGSQDGRPIAL